MTTNNVTTNRVMKRNLLKKAFNYAIPTVLGAASVIACSGGDDVTPAVDPAYKAWQTDSVAAAKNVIESIDLCKNDPLFGSTWNRGFLSNINYYPENLREIFANQAYASRRTSQGANSAYGHLEGYAPFKPKADNNIDVVTIYIDKYANGYIK